MRILSLLAIVGLLTIPVVTYASPAPAPTAVVPTTPTPLFVYNVYSPGSNCTGFHVNTIYFDSALAQYVLADTTGTIPLDYGTCNFTTCPATWTSSVYSLTGTFTASASGVCLLDINLTGTGKIAEF